MEKTKLFKKADVILIIVVVVIGIALFIPRLINAKDKNKVYAYIYVSGKEEQRIDLNSVKENYEINMQCKPNLTLLVENGRICVKEAECPDKLCVKCGWLSKNMDTAVCLPANVIVTIKAVHDDGADVVTY